MIWQQWPVSGFWVIGLFVGIDMIFNGWTWIMLAFRLKSLPRPARPPWPDGSPWKGGSPEESTWPSTSLK